MPMYNSLLPFSDRLDCSMSIEMLLRPWSLAIGNFPE